MSDHYLFAASFLSSRLSQSWSACCSVAQRKALALAVPLKQKQTKKKNPKLTFAPDVPGSAAVSDFIEAKI